MIRASLASAAAMARASNKCNPKPSSDHSGTGLRRNDPSAPSNGAQGTHDAVALDQRTVPVRVQLSGRVLLAVEHRDDRQRNVNA
jgi:hypothetical protein